MSGASSSKKLKVDGVENLEKVKGVEVVKNGEKENVSTSPRRKIPCPLLTCKGNVVHLPRHMRNVHRWTKEASSKVLLKYNIRKRKSKEAKKKDYHIRRRCPISNCHSIVQRLSAHLQKVHKLDKSSKKYADAILDAGFARDNKHGMIRWQEEKLKTKRWEVFKENPEQSKSDDEERSDDNEVDVVDDGSTDSEFSENGNDDDDFDGDISDDHKMPAVPRVDLPPLITEFQEWLASPDGGQKDEKTFSQHASQLYIMLKAIDDSENIQSLFDLKLIRQVFLKSYVNDRRYEAGTIKSYLMSLRHFYSFLLSDKPDGVTFNWLDISASREKVKMWSASYKRKDSTRKWQKLEEDMLNRLTPSNIRKFEKSSAAREAIKMIGEHLDAPETTVVTQASFTLVRDFLFTQIFIDNANRPGVLAHMTMDEYRNIRKQDGRYVIAVKKHKTAHVHGPARIVLSEKLKSWLSVFVDVMRGQVGSSSSGPVFLSWNGNGMKSGHITKAVQSVFKKAGVDVKVTSTSFRKAAVTKVHMDQPGMSGKLAGFMAHREATAKKYYLIAEKSKTSVEVSKNLGRLMRTDDVNKDDVTCTDESQCEYSCKANETRTDKEMENVLTGETTEIPENGKRKRIPWSDEESKLINEVFKKEIMENDITMDVIRHRIETHSELRGMSPRRVYDKLKKVNQKESISHAEPPKECEVLQDKLNRIHSIGSHTEETRTGDDQLSTSIFAPTERNSNFNNHDVSTMHTLFKDMIYERATISAVEIEKRCGAGGDGLKLLQNSATQTLVNRIKYERRKFRLGMASKTK